LEFFQQLGSLGCLVDSIVDIKKDVDDKVLRFEPLIKDRINLYFKTIQRGTIFILKHPGLYKSFLYSLINNIKDKYL